MCGLNGIFAYHPAAGAPAEAELLATRDHMRARGPDGTGSWWSADRRCALGHRRLSIIDLSELGAQPMASDDGRLVVTYNGEIYNFPALRAELEATGVRFRTNADTEVLLHLYRRDGADMVHSLRGMYALALWDHERGGLLLARDPYGIKPLYTANDGWTFRFASQVKALLAGGRVSRDPEPAGVVGFHLFGNVPEPFTLYRDIRALPAGHTQWVDRFGPHEPKAFASIAAALADGRGSIAPDAEIFERVQAAVLDSVRAHLLADVEVGAFLSAGVDSGALVGLMRDAGQRDIRAITLGFEEFRGSAEDEAPLAALVARTYGCDHRVRQVAEAEFRQDMPAILQAMDQPSIDGVNTWFVAKAAREAGLKVAISGLGGDELLAGYPSFRDIPKWVRWLAVPASVPGLGAVARRGLAMLAPAFSKQSPKALGLLEYGANYPGAYLLRRGLFLPFELKAILDPDLVDQGLSRLDPIARLKTSMTPDPRSSTGRVSALESANYMRHQLLRDADWAGMAHSLEIRTPLVDFQLLRALAPIIPHLNATTGKRALAAAPSVPLPEQVQGRRKTGFGVPSGHWLDLPNRGRQAADNKGAASRHWARQVFAAQSGEERSADHHLAKSAA